MDWTRPNELDLDVEGRRLGFDDGFDMIEGLRAWGWEWGRIARLLCCTRQTLARHVRVYRSLLRGAEKAPTPYLRYQARMIARNGHKPPPRGKK